MIFSFTKMQALGNDFVVINAMSQQIEMTATLARALSDRHRGVGCDQVLLLTQPKNAAADFGYRIFNSDGTEVFQCGNGARCMGLFVREKKLSDKKTVVFETQRGLIRATCIEDEVQVDIAKPDFHPASLPFVTSQATPPYQLTIADRVIEFDVVSVGNPHCVIKNNHYSEAEMIAIGEALNQNKCFPDGVNVGFVQVISRDAIQLRVYERGAGMTQACGSGACAAVAAGCRAGYLNTVVSVHQVGGVLRVEWKSFDEMIQLRGVAKIVFEGSCSFSQIV